MWIFDSPSHFPQLTSCRSSSSISPRGFLIIFSSSAPLERHSHNRGMEFQVFSRSRARSFPFSCLFGLHLYGRKAVHCFLLLNLRVDKRDELRRGRARRSNDGDNIIIMMIKKCLMKFAVNSPVAAWQLALLPTWPGMILSNHTHESSFT